MNKLDRRTFLKVLGAGTAMSFGTSPLMNAFADPKGDRVKITMNGKFLAYKKW